MEFPQPRFGNCEENTALYFAARGAISALLSIGGHDDLVKQIADETDRRLGLGK